MSPLLWCISYDPIILLMALVSGHRCPTYVDDLAALLQDAAQALRVCFLLPWVSRAIGLHVATHTCRAKRPRLQIMKKHVGYGAWHFGATLRCIKLTA